MKDYNGAILNYNKAIKLNNKSSNYFYDRGLAYKSLHKYEKAIKDFDEAIRLNPKNHLSYSNRGLIKF